MTRHNVKAILEFMKKIALYLAGGGARGAYQAGVLKALAEILDVKNIPFTLISGVSVGSVNAGVLTTHATDFKAATENLAEFWRQIHTRLVFNASNYAIGKSLMGNILHLLISRKKPGYILDTSPLRALINQGIDFNSIRENVQNGIVSGLEIISHRYETGQTVSFFQQKSAAMEGWNYPRHLSQEVDLTADHILASSALPLFFPSVNINGFHFGDGSMGLISPLRGAIRYNVEKILILGTRSTPVFVDVEKLRNQEIGYATILGAMLNGLFTDNLDRDIEMVNRMNDVARLLSLWKKRHSPWHPIETLHLKPSIDISDFAKKYYPSMPVFLRFMLNRLGAKNSGDLLSFLLFESKFTGKLIDLGHKDTMAIHDSIRAFFES